MSKVKKQHYVPRFYLSRWGLDSNPKQIYVYDKENKREYISNIKDVASANYFYDYPKLEEKQKIDWIEKLKNNESLEESQIYDTIKLTEEQIVEKTLGELESYSAPIIENIIKKLENFSELSIEYFLKHKILTESDIIELSYYIATQYVRTKEFRIVIEQMSKISIKHISNFILLNIEKLENDTELLKKIDKESFDKFVESVKSGKFNKDSYTVEIYENYTKINHIQIMLKLIEDLARILSCYKWVMLVNNTDIPFLTSDTPVIEKANLAHPLYSYGFLSKGIEVIFPISPKYAINILEPSYLEEKAHILLEHNIFELSRKSVIHYNDLMIQKATSQIYSNQNDFAWVEKRLKDSPEVGDKNRTRIKEN